MQYIFQLILLAFKIICNWRKVYGLAHSRGFLAMKSLHHMNPVAALSPYLQHTVLYVDVSNTDAAELLLYHARHVHAWAKDNDGVTVCNLWSFKCDNRVDLYTQPC